MLASKVHRYGRVPPRKRPDTAVVRAARFANTSHQLLRKGRKSADTRAVPQVHFASHSARHSALTKANTSFIMHQTSARCFIFVLFVHTHRQEDTVNSETLRVMEV
jgi:hypothetical protein